MDKLFVRYKDSSFLSTEFFTVYSLLELFDS